MKTEKDKQAFIFYSNMHLLWTSKFTEKITKLYALIHPIRLHWIFWADKRLSAAPCHYNY